LFLKSNSLKNVVLNIPTRNLVTDQMWKKKILRKSFIFYYMLEHVVKIWQFYSLFFEITRSRAIFSQKSFCCVEVIISELKKCKTIQQIKKRKKDSLLYSHKQSSDLSCQSRFPYNLRIPVHPDHHQNWEISKIRSFPIFIAWSG